MLVSTFEILLKPQLPTNLPQLGNVSRKILQGYFLTIANPNDFNVALDLSFTVSPSLVTIAVPNVLAISEAFEFSRLLMFFDVNGVNQTVELKPTERPDTRIASLSIPAKDTGLFILQPNPFAIIPTLPGFPPGFPGNPLQPFTTLLNVANFEVRGYVEIEPTSPAMPVQLLLTPEHRGTFFKDLTSEPQLDQIAYSLPTATGGSLFTL